MYLFRGPQEAPLYIGKAVNLRRRVQQHLRAFAARAGGAPGAVPAGASGATGGEPSAEPRARSASQDRRHSLLRRFERIDWIPCPTELHALLLEDELIKRHLPPGNRRQKQYLRNRFLALDEGPLPSLRLLEREEAGGQAELFGPFRSEFAARRLLEIARRPLDPAARPILPLGRPPVVRSAAGGPPAAWTAAGLAEAVRSTRAFLLGEGEELLEMLARRMKRLSRERRFEEAARARDQLLEVRRFCLRQRFFQAFRSRPLLLLDRGRWAGTYLFLEGRLAYYTPELLGRRRARQIRELLPAGRRSDGLPAGGPRSPRAPLPVEILWDRAMVLAAWRRQDRLRRTLHFLED